jgi:hypothetical protein
MCCVVPEFGRSKEWKKKKNTNCKNSQRTKGINQGNRRKMNRRNIEVDRHCFEKDEGTSWGLEVDGGRSSGGLRTRSCLLGMPPERECQRLKFEGRR